jgi:hypothetical protein
VGPTLGRAPASHQHLLVEELRPRRVANERRLPAALTAGDRDALGDLLRILATGLGDTTLG